MTDSSDGEDDYTKDLDKMHRNLADTENVYDDDEMAEEFDKSKSGPFGEK